MASRTGSDSCVSISFSSLQLLIKQTLRAIYQSSSQLVFVEISTSKLQAAVPGPSSGLSGSHNSVPLLNLSQPPRAKEGEGREMFYTTFISHPDHPSIGHGQIAEWIKCTPLP